MTNIQQSKVKMYYVVQMCMNNNKKLWENIPYIVQNVATLNAKLEAILDASTKQIRIKTGFGVTKKKRRATLLKTTLLVLRILKSYAAFTDNNILQSKLKITPSRLLTSSANDFLAYANTIHTLGKENLIGAGGVGLTQALLDDLKAKNLNFSIYINAPADQNKITVNATSTIKELIADTDNFLYMILDNNMSIFEDSEPLFYSIYFNCRTVLNSPTTKLAMRCKINDATTNEALPGARVVIKDHDIDRKSSPKGQIHVKNLSEGKHTVTVSMKGYVTQAVQVTYKAGVTTIASVGMVKSE